MTTPDILLFVSHVSEDRSAATEIVGELERRGVRCWMAPRDVRPGKPFDDEIADAIDASRAMLLIFSERCNESEYIRREVTVAGEAGKIIIPFRIENVLPRRGLRVRLSDLHWIDGFVSRERAIDELVANINPFADKISLKSIAGLPLNEEPQIFVQSEGGAHIGKADEQIAQSTPVGDGRDQLDDNFRSLKNVTVPERVADQSRDEELRIVVKSEGDIQRGEADEDISQAQHHGHRHDQHVKPRPLVVFLSFGAMLVAIASYALLPNNPNDAPAFINRGNAYIDKKDYDRAITDYNEAIRLDPNDALAFTDRSIAYSYKNDLERALADASEAIRLDPKFDSAFNSRCADYILKGQSDRAIADCTEAIRLNPKNAAAFDNRCQARAIIGQLHEALTDCNEALRLIPNDTDTLNNRGLTYLKMGQLYNAIADYNTALKLDPKFSGSLYGRGIVKRKMGDIIGADADIAAAKTTQADIAEEYANYGVK
jgi:tetratricopeptide (TPR) repeat protein